VGVDYTGLTVPGAFGGLTVPGAFGQKVHRRG
jgi:hypothetical protein